MATVVTKVGPDEISSGEIKFSKLRKYFLKMNPRTTYEGEETFDEDTGPVSASQLLRDINGDDPNLPDAYENSAVSSENDWVVSTLRNTVIFYYLKQTGVNREYDIATQDIDENEYWQENVNKSITKFAFLHGTMGSNDPYTPGARLSTSSKNLTIDVYGMIYGGAGNPGLPVDPEQPFAEQMSKGGRGGDALLINDPTDENHISQNVKVVVKSITAQLFGGGGGGGSGGRGGTGGKGADGIYSYAHCTPYTVHHTEGPFHHHNRGVNHHHAGHTFSHSHSHCSYGSVPSTGGDGGTGGFGGYGGKGLGYDVSDPEGEQDGTFIGSGGLANEGNDGNSGYPTTSEDQTGPGGTAGTGGDGGDGGLGGDGSTWGTAGNPGKEGFAGLPGGDSGSGDNFIAGEPGEEGAPGGEGGDPGSAIRGTNYTYSGYINTSGENITIRGPIVGGILFGS